MLRYATFDLIVVWLLLELIISCTNKLSVLSRSDYMP